MKKYLLTSLLALSACSMGQNIHDSQIISISRTSTESTRRIEDPSFELSDLLDTAIEPREITLNVYIEDSEILWDYHDYRDELFSYVKAFFAEQKIECHVQYSESRKTYNVSNEFGVEIYDSTVDMFSRYGTLYNPRDNDTEEVERQINMSQAYALTEFGISLINGGWENFRENSSRKDRSFYLEPFSGTNFKEIILKQNAANVVHEVLHCMSLCHPGRFFPNIVEKYINDAPNILSQYCAEVSEENPIGYNITNLQVGLMHSYVAGNNTFIAFKSVGRDLDKFEEMFAKENKIKLNDS